MPVAKITGQGLTSIAVAVGLLWSCVIGEKAIVRRAASDDAAAMESMRSLQMRARRPRAATPVRPTLRRNRPQAG